MYRMCHADEKVRLACTTLIENIEKVESLRFIPMGDSKERQALQKVLALKLNGDMRAVQDIMAEMMEILNNNEIW